MNTKRIARLAETTVAHVLEVARDLELTRWYDRETHCWRVTDRDGEALIGILSDRG